MITNQRSLLHYIKAKRSDDPAHKDRYATDNAYVGGFDPLGQQPYTSPTYLNEEELEKASMAYYDTNSTKLPGGLLGEARLGVEKFLRNRLGWNKPGETSAGRTRVRKGEDFSAETKNLVLEMMVKRKDEIIDTAATMLILNLNDPLLGICDPELGLRVVCGATAEPATVAKRNHGHRINDAYDFAATISQAALDNITGSRRERKKRTSYGEGPGGLVSIDQQSSDTGKSTDLPETQSGRRTQSTSSMSNQKIHYNARKGKIEREQWLTRYFGGVRQGMINKGGSKLTASLNRLEDYIDRITQIGHALYNDALEKTGNPTSAMKQTTEELEPTLRSIHPELKERYSDEDIKELIAKHNYVPDVKEPETPDTFFRPIEPKDEEEQWKVNLMNDLIGPKGEGWSKTEARDDDGNEYWTNSKKYTIDQLSALKDENVLALIYIYLNKNGIAEYGVPLLMRIAKYNGVPLSVKDAVKRVEKAGYQANQKVEEAPIRIAGEQPPTQQATGQQSTGQIPFQQMLANIPKYYEQILSRPEAASSKLALQTYLNNFRKMAATRQPSPAEYKPYLAVYNYLGKAKEAPEAAA